MLFEKANAHPAEKELNGASATAAETAAAGGRVEVCKEPEVQ